MAWRWAPASFTSSRSTPSNTRANIAPCSGSILLGALPFRLTLFPLPPSLSTDLYRYRWDGHVQNAGWNPYAVAPTDPRLAPLRDPGWYVMPVPEIPTMYPAAV